MRLTYSKADGTLAEIKLTDQPLTIGRSDTASITLSDEKVSRMHCSIQLIDGAYFLKDLQSRNGTLVNEKPVSEIKLEHGDRITVGSTLFTFEAQERPGTRTIFMETAQDMAGGKGYGTLLRKIVDDLKPPAK